MKRKVKCPNCDNWIESKENGQAKSHFCESPRKQVERIRKGRTDRMEKIAEADRRRNLHER